MKKLLRILFTLFILLLVVVGVAFFVLNKKLPEGKAGLAAEQLADKMLKAINIEAWNKVQFLEWDFPGGHHHLWDRNRNLVEVKWDNHRALIHPNIGTGSVYTDGKLEEGVAKKTLVEKAIHLFQNDSFWLIAYTKIKDPGTTRKIVELEEGNQGLLVTYTSGGVTPGDSYLWLLSDDGRPYAWQMWVDLIPLGGMELTWEDWRVLPNGALLAPSHKAPFFSVDILNVQVGNSLQELGHDSNTFAKILN
ncbi:MAG TPA: hypothetical protein ENJ82_18390 [Bacteroidetes bacterium]|nr:hypothetical protein [Bacteroidota bacterium]